MPRFAASRLREMLALYASNYFSLLPLTPQDDAPIYLSLGQPDTVETIWQLSIAETTPYSQLLRIRQLEQPLKLELMVRMYHDSRQAEVQAAQKIRRLRSYKSSDLGRVDERREWNIFLQDWIRLCQTHAQALDAKVLEEKLNITHL